MMKKIVTLFFLTLSFLTNISAQEILKRCATVEAIEYRENVFPGYQKAIQETFKAAKKAATDNLLAENSEVYTIQTVFHIVYTSPEQNQPDEMVYSQLEVLNEDFRRLNVNAMNTREEFLPVAADAMIQFELAEIDPFGNPTTGITRTEGNPGFLGFTTSPFDNAVKHTSAGGIDAWDTERYLNIWVCDMSIVGLPLVLGYAYPPANVPGWPDGASAPSPEDEGVVIQYQTLGRNNPLAVDVFEVVSNGRTLTHEMGHFLGLRHVWGDGDCNEDDGLADTPNAADNAQQVCDWSKNTCVETEDPQLPDMIENFMDYAADSCANIFTIDQVGIMRAVLEGPRSGLLLNPLTSTNDLTNKNIFTRIFPNPTQGNLQIEINNQERHAYTIGIKNHLGQIVTPTVQDQADQSIHEFNLSSLANGIYFVEIISGNYYSTKKVVVMK